MAAMIGLQMTDPNPEPGSVSFDLSLRNASTETIFAPLTLVVSDISSPSGGVTVANAGNGKTGVGATWDYSSLVEADRMLTAGELSDSRQLKFNNPANEVFTVTFRVVGVLASDTRGPGRSANGNSASSNSSSGNGSRPRSVPDRSAIGPLTNALLKVTYDPLSNQATWQVMRL